MVGILGAMIAGGAVGHRENSNRQVDQQNAVASVIFGKDVEEAYQQRAEERRHKRDDATHARDREHSKEDAQTQAAREEVIYTRNRGDKLQDFDRTKQFELEKLSTKHGMILRWKI